MDPSGSSALRIIQAIYDEREAFEFEFEDHCRGPNRGATPNDILQRVRDLSGIDVSEAFDRADLQDLIKKHIRFARQNSIHVSPTFMIDGFIETRMSSGDDVQDWVSVLGFD